LLKFRLSPLIYVVCQLNEIQNILLRTNPANPMRGRFQAGLDTQGYKLPQSQPKLAYQKS
jgi:hypothetical protein